MLRRCRRRRGGRLDPGIIVDCPLVIVAVEAIERTYSSRPGAAQAKQGLPISLQGIAPTGDHAESVSAVGLRPCCRLAGLAVVPWRNTHALTLSF